MSVPFTRPLTTGCFGSDVEGVSRALCRAGFFWTLEQFMAMSLTWRRTYGWRRAEAVNKLRKAEGWIENGVYNEACHHVLVDGGYFDARAVQLMKRYTPPLPPKPERIRTEIVDFTRRAEAAQSVWHYTQQRPYTGLGLEPERTHYNDCSSYVALAYFWARKVTGLSVPDPTGYNYSGWGNCMAPSTRLLTTDLLWVPAGDLEVGDEIWAFEPEAPGQFGIGGGQGRRYRRAVITSSFLAEKECVRVHFATGESLVCSIDHPWLTRGRSGKPWAWREARHLMPRTGARFCLRPFMPWERLDTWEAGWVAGMLDGEGHIGGSKGHPSHVGITQAEGATATRLMEVLPRYADWNIAPKTRSAPNVRPQVGMQTNGGGLPVAMALLGRVGAERLIEKFDIDGALMQARAPEQVVQVVAVETIGRHPIQSISTSIGTYLAEGFAVHNTWDDLDGHPRVASPYQVGDLAHYDGHVTICRKAGTATTAIWSSFGREAGPERTSLRYRSDFRFVVRPPLLL